MRHNIWYATFVNHLPFIRFWTTQPTTSQ